MFAISCRTGSRMRKSGCRRTTPLRPLSWQFRLSGAGRVRAPPPPSSPPGGCAPNLSSSLSRLQGPCGWLSSKKDFAPMRMCARVRPTIWSGFAPTLPRLWSRRSTSHCLWRTGSGEAFSTCPSVRTAIVVLTSCEDSPLTDDHRDLLWRAWGVPVFEQLRGLDGTIIAQGMRSA